MSTSPEMDHGSRRRSNLRLGIILGLLAATYFFGFIAKYYVFQ